MIISPLYQFAWFSPMPPTRSGIADYSRDLLPHFDALAHVVPFWHNITAYPAQRWQFDMPIYHLGNSRHHVGIYAMLQQHPGVVVLHDFGLHHFMSEQAYARELGYALGHEQALAIRHGVESPDLITHPLNQRVLDLALGIIVHSHFVADQIRVSHPDRPLAVIPMPIPPPLNPPQGEGDRSPSLWERLGEGTPFKFGMVGQITPAKRLDLCVEAFAQLKAAGANIELILIGEAADVDLPALIDDHDEIIWTDYIPDFDQFQQRVASLDVVINLRDPTVGETSAAALRALAHGKPVIVFDHGWYRELPDAVTIKIPPHTNDVIALVNGMNEAQKRCAEMGEAAIQYIKTVHDPRAIAQQYTQFIAQLLA